MIQASPRPRLAPGVTLAGRMRESAYADPPWLVDRAGLGYAHLPELLYRIAEQCDGRHTPDEIARQLAETTGRPLTGPHVRMLIDAKLAPSGLVIPDAGAPPAALHQRRAKRSPLALGLRMQLVDPRWVEPPTRVLRGLYRPPVLAPVLVAAAACEAWLYVAHGLSGSLRQALDRPGLLILVWLGVVASAAFHELGHATALRYGGGEVRGMGFGFYLAFPAFYTDVSDNYRLPRWSRVRTDLGGFYFNLIFVLGVVGLYLLTHQEWLLLVVVLINLDILHQLLPFVRLDGYWTLADLTGMPDFFSLMGRRLRGRAATPALKPWARVVFGVYAAATIPLLIILLAVMVLGFPRVLATAWDALQQQLSAFTGARAAGDLVGVAAAALQSLVLALPIAGLVSVLWSTGRTGFEAIWRWGSRGRLRRAASLLVCGALAGLVAIAWAPQFGGLAPRSAAASPEAPQSQVELPPPTEGGTSPEARHELAVAAPTPVQHLAPTPRPVTTSPSPFVEFPGGPP